MVRLCLQKPSKVGLLGLLHSGLTRGVHSLVCISSYLFHSGNQEHPGDILLNTTVDVLPLKVRLLLLLAVSSFISVAGIKCPDTKQLKRKELILPYSSRLESSLWGNQGRDFKYQVTSYPRLRAERKECMHAWTQISLFPLHRSGTMSGLRHGSAPGGRALPN